MSTTSSVLEQIRTLLRAESIAAREVHHAPTRTSEESAAARGEPLAIGGKAIVMKVDQRFGLFVFSAVRRLDSNAVRRQLQASNSRFATPAELLELTGLVPGSVPPFGEPILPLPLYADPSIVANERIAFNAGSLTDSIVMPVADWRRLARPTVFSFTRDA